MSRSVRHQQYLQPRPHGRGTGLGHRLVTEEELSQRERERQERVDEHVRRSKTRRCMDIVFLFLYGGCGSSLLLHLLGSGELLQGIWWFPWLARLPAMLVFHPDPDFWNIGPITILKLDVVALAIYGVVHWFLIGMHRAVTYQRVFIPE